MKKLLFLIITGIFLLTSCSSNTEKTAEDTGLTFATQDVYGNEVTQDIFGEKSLTMVNVWATYCPPCLAEMPDLGELAVEYSEDINIVGLVLDVFNTDGTYSESQILLAQEIIQMTGANYTHLLPSEELILEILADVAAVPTTFFYDAEGNPIGKTVVGSKTKDQWITSIDEHLELVNYE